MIMTSSLTIQSTPSSTDDQHVQPRRALVLGATGSIGSAITQRLLQQGWQVTALKRNIKGMSSVPDIHWLQGDVLNEEDVVNASRGCQVIVHAVNPAGYRNWETLVLPMLNNTLQAARHHRACVVVPGNIYNFSPLAGTDIKEDMPQQPTSKKGHVRVLMEQQLEAYAQQGGRCIILRCGDFFGPTSGNGWFEQVIAKKGIASKRLFTPYNPNTGHQWAYLPDVAETMMQLILRRDELPNFARFHMGGHWDHDGKQIVGAAAKVIAGQNGTTPRIQTFPWWVIRTASIFNKTFKELLEMRYLWQQPLRMNNEKLVALLGAEPHTPLEEAVTLTLAR